MVVAVGITASPRRQAATAAALAAGQTVDLTPPWFHPGYRQGTRLGGVFYPDADATE